MTPRRLRFVLGLLGIGIVVVVLAGTRGGSQDDPDAPGRPSGPRSDGLTIDASCDRPGNQLCGSTNALAALYVDGPLSLPGIPRAPGTIMLVDVNTARFELLNYLSPSGTPDTFLGTLDFSFRAWQHQSTPAKNQRRYMLDDCSEAGDVACEILWEVRPGLHLEDGSSGNDDVYTDVIFTVRRRVPLTTTTP